MADAIKVLDVELSRPLEDIAALDGYRALQALVRLHGVRYNRFGRKALIS